MTPTDSVDRSVDHLFRHHAGEMVALLARILGPKHLDLVEEVVQDAFLRALGRWPYDGQPANPKAWITQVAKNRALDVIRRDRRWLDRQPEIERQVVQAMNRAASDLVAFSREIRDDQLKLTFACCHPVLPRNAQVALTLKSVGGFSTVEIARAFLREKSTIAQRLVRARRLLRQQAIRLDMPEPGDLAPRLDSVLESVYLIFNEGYAAFEGEDLVRSDLCMEAIRLGTLLSEHPTTAAPRVDALLALFLFQAARLPARADANGQLMLLDEQDRSLWNSDLIRRGLEHFRHSAAGSEETEYHLQAEIASCHTLSSSDAETDWSRILGCYDRLWRLNPSPIVALNRAVAVARVDGTEAAIAALEAIDAGPGLQRYYPLHVTRGELLARIGETDAAAAELEVALAIAGSEPVRRFVSSRIQRLGR